MPTPLSAQLWTYRARIIGNHDGDTVGNPSTGSVVIDAGFYVAFSPPHGLRILGVNTPEINSPDPETRNRALAARDYTAAWLAGHASHLGGGCTADWPFAVRTRKADVFARPLTSVECGQAHDLASDLLQAGFAVAFTP